MNIFLENLQRGLDGFNIDLDTAMQKQLEDHWHLVIEFNKKFNLTAILDDREAAIKHYVDCLLMLPLVREMAQQALQKKQPLIAADIGSGAGFPGLVLALACPQSRWVLLEASGKKLAFLLYCIQKLAIENLYAMPKRAEMAGREASLRETFNLVTARAVAPLPMLLEYALPLLRQGGVFVAAKGPALASEEALAANALNVLGGEIGKKYEFTLPDEEKRIIACYKKITPTPAKYPRRAGIPKKRPL
ncbi:MAG: 16S rRNA (guanine(527)-N(7))-methyltransferase RsmG [Clostridiales bacterium]|nr:16S rRNA (guanine(527)-N(7))-methyltransferase RsmG [Clostridiales bacterium]